jgi:hypothetical protein
MARTSPSFRAREDRAAERAERVLHAARDNRAAERIKRVLHATREDRAAERALGPCDLHLARAPAMCDLNTRPT